MRVNVYTEELVDEADGKPFAEIVTADYVSSRTGEPMKNYGLRVFLRSPPELHYIPGRDDDRSAVTFWVGKASNLEKLVDALTLVVRTNHGDMWRDKTDARCAEAEAALTVGKPYRDRRTGLMCVDDAAGYQYVLEKQS
jgi:hypothetical protein